MNISLKSAALAVAEFIGGAKDRLGRPDVGASTAMMDARKRILEVATQQGVQGGHGTYLDQCAAVLRAAATGQDIERDPAYGNINFTHEGSYCIYTPLVTQADPVSVRILSDDEEAQTVLDSDHPGDFMTGTPSIEMRLPIANGDNLNVYLTWQEAYNLGRALIDKANEAHYG